MHMHVNVINNNIRHTLNYATVLRYRFTHTIANVHQ